MANPNPQEQLAMGVRAGLTESRWLALTEGFCNLAATITNGPLTLFRHLQFVSRIPDNDLEKPVQFQKVVGGVRVFDELNSLLDR